MAKKVALYLRVSTVEQDTTNQRRELEAVAERHGWEIVTIEREMIRERVLSGMARAKSQGKHCGRPKTATDVEKAIKATLAGGIGMND